MAKTVEELERNIIHCCPTERYNHVLCYVLPDRHSLSCAEKIRHELWLLGVILATFLNTFVERHLLAFWATVCKTVRPMLSDRCLSVLSVCLSVCPFCDVGDVGVLWPNGWMDQELFQKVKSLRCF